MRGPAKGMQGKAWNDLLDRGLPCAPLPLRGCSCEARGSNMRGRIWADQGPPHANGTGKGDGMLELRPNCEMCDRDLPAGSTEARICSYECTFCSNCVETQLHNVCPNCGGGFVPRPIRPTTARRTGVSLHHQPAGTKRRTLKHSQDDIAALVAATRDVPAEQR